jgi:MFS family permease
MLIVFRAMQGIGVAACIPASVSNLPFVSYFFRIIFFLQFAQWGILARTFPPSRSRSLAFASFAAGAPVGAALGTVINGVLIEKTTFVISRHF